MRISARILHCSMLGDNRNCEADPLPDAIVNALERLIKFAPSEQSKPYFLSYTLLTDSLQSARAAAKNQFAMIRYEVEKNRADNLRLQKENADSNNRLWRQRFFSGGALLMLLVLVFGGGEWYRRRKQRLELEAQGRIKAFQIRTSKKVHDVVANGLYRVMTELEYDDDFDK